MMNNENYTQSVLEKVVNKYLEQNLPTSDAGLKLLTDQTDNIVWDIATYIYKESGHSLDFSLIRSLIEVHIEYLKKNLAQQEHLAEEKSIDEEKILADSNPLLWTQCVEELGKLGKDTEKLTHILFKLKNIIAEHLNFNLDEIKLESYAKYYGHYDNIFGMGSSAIRYYKTYNSSGDFQYDDLDYIEMITALENEFEIDIPDDEAEKFTTVGDIFNYVAHKIL